MLCYYQIMFWPSKVGKHLSQTLRNKGRGEREGKRGEGGGREREKVKVPTKDWEGRGDLTIGNTIESLRNLWDTHTHTHTHVHGQIPHTPTHTWLTDWL